MAKKICVIGASSFIGRQVFQTLRHTSACGGMEVLGTYFSSAMLECDYLDITDAEAVRSYLATNEPDEVVLVAGIKDVRACEADESLAMMLNLDPVETMCNAIVESDMSTRLLYISSDYVFDAKQGNYCVDSPVNPTTAYGRSKVLAEDRVLRGDIFGCVIRTAAVMGCSDGFLNWLVGTLEKPDTVKLFGNSFFRPHRCKCSRTA